MCQLLMCIKFNVFRYPKLKAKLSLCYFNISVKSVEMISFVSSFLITFVPIPPSIITSFHLKRVVTGE
jgi:hypothetical protein